MEVKFNRKKRHFRQNNLLYVPKCRPIKSIVVHLFCVWDFNIKMQKYSTYTLLFRYLKNSNVNPLDCIYTSWGL